MGRCYEFGVSITDGCEHAMVVPPEGGRCDCPTCGASCPGQFTGCEAVVSVGGYVPIAAPAWAKPGAATASTADAAENEAAIPVRLRAVPASRRSTAVAATSSSEVVLAEDLADVRSILSKLLERPDRAAEAVEILRHEMATRDNELLETFNRLAEAYDRLTEEVANDRAVRETLAESVLHLADQVAQRRSMFGVRRPS